MYLKSMNTDENKTKILSHADMGKKIFFFLHVNVVLVSILVCVHFSSKRVNVSLSLSLIKHLYRLFRHLEFFYFDFVYPILALETFNSLTLLNFVFTIRYRFRFFNLRCYLPWACAKPPAKQIWYLHETK